LDFFGFGEKKPEPPKQMTQAGAALAEQTTQARDKAKPLQKRVDELDEQIKADEKKLLDQKKLGKYGAEEIALEAKIKKSTEEREKVATELVEQEKKIATLARMESQLRQKQTQDRQALARLEGANLRDMEKVKELNVEKIEAEKKGDRAGAQKAQGKIDELNKGIQNRAPQIQTMQAELKTSAVGNTKPEDVLEFSGASGGRENFDGLSADMKGALLSAGQQYFEQTGQKLKMNSGFRSPEDQLRLYNETKDAKRPGIGPTGMPVAQPGSSPHETGMAVDIQNYMDPKAVAALNSAGLRQTVPKDPVHFQLQAADGGVFSGPDSGYPAALHGEEAVIPLNNGGGNFVKVFEDMAMMMGQQVGAIDELIRVAKNGNDIQTKILRSQA
jgi:LAS superfamily LD-carboxypeptidase LdcB